MTAKKNKFTAAALLIISLFSITAFANEAREITKECDITCLGITKERICDNSVATHSEGTDITVTVKANENIGGIYLKYNNYAPDGGMLNGEIPIAQNGFVHEYIELGGTDTANLLFPHADICDIFVYSEGELPSDVQRWEEGNHDTDILLCATHSDDDQLFFAGLLPYYAGHIGANVRVSYFVNHFDTYNRTHELLDGLWHCGVRNYPDISPFPDGYSESTDGAINYLKSRNVNYGDVLAYQKSIIEKYKPLVVVLHDFNGEYGHGAHMLNTKSFVEAFETAEEGQYVPEKVYVHLYDKNKIELNIDQPLECFEGKSAFNISQEAFNFHKSQHWTWFYGWIYGKGTKITNSVQINKYSPSQYGLYFTRVGEDIKKNDLLENVVIYTDKNKSEQKQVASADVPSKIPSVRQEATTKNDDEQTSVTKKEFSPFYLLPIIFIIIVILSIFLINSNKKKR